MSADQNEARRDSRAGKVACIIVNYRSPWEMLDACLASVFENRGNVEVRVILVDNCSGDGGARRAKHKFGQLFLTEMPANAGFAAAVNRGLAEAVEDYVLMLNTDAVLTPEALKEMMRVLGDAGDKVAGVAPKMMSSAYPGLIDAIGTVMPRWGAPFNRGIGQCDLGQYDRSEEVAGVCFGAALIKRRLFEPAAIGPLYEGYFLYFEDADWCMRAASQGYKFLTAPRAVVMHAHSGVTRHESLDFKYRLIELNTLKMVTRTFASGRGAARIVAARSLRLLARTFIRRRFIRTNLSTLSAYAASLPRLLAERRRLKARRIIDDGKNFRLAAGEHAYFDTVNYRPQHCLDSLVDSYTRVWRCKKEPALKQILASLEALRHGAAAGSPPAPDHDLEKSFSDKPPCAQNLLKAALRDE